MKKGTCEIIAILDRSGSMEGLVNDVIGGYNQYIEDQAKLPGDAKVTLVTFDDRIETVYSGLRIQDVPKLTKETYYARGMTALYDAIGKTFNEVGTRLAQTPEEERPEKVIVIINTDGEENNSKEFKHAQIKEMIQHQEQKYSWQVLFLGANIDSTQVASGLGVGNLNNVANFVPSGLGTRAAFATYSKSSTSLRNGKILGLDEVTMADLYSASMSEVGGDGSTT